MKKEHNFTRKLFISYSSVMFILIFLIFAIVFFVLYNDTVRKEIDTQQEFVQKTQQQIDTSLQNMDRIANGLLYNKTFMRIMYNGLEETSSTQDSNEVLGIMISLDAPQFLSHRIIAFTPQAAGSYFNISKTGDDHSAIQNAILSYPYYDRIIQADGNKVILPVHTDPFDAFAEPVYSVARAISDGINVYGFIVVQNDFAELQELCAVDSYLGDVVLFSPEGEVIYPLNMALSLQGKDDFYKRLYGTISSQADDAGYFQLDSHQISYSVSDYSDWVTVMYCPISVLMPDISLVGIFLLSMAVVLVSVMILMQILTKRMAAPLHELNQQISQISFANLAMTMPHYDITEIENINLSFQTMLDHLRKEIAHNAQSRANEERANFIALQSQMNPHTIYNTIAMIESVCYLNGDFEASRLCIAFSKMLRYISDNTKIVYTVEDEISHVENYAELMKKRYENRLVIEITCDPALSGMVIPKFTIQPLVENSIKHGMNHHSQPFMVRVTVAAVPSGWHIAVSDNGDGFAAGKIADIYAQFAQCDISLTDHKSDILKSKIDNMALNNIYIRWKIVNGDRFSMLLENHDDSGCTVDLSVRETG